MSTWKIPLFATKFGPEEEQAVLRPLRRGWLTMGPEVERLEAELKEASGVRHAVAVSNCTAALHVVAHALDLRGSEVICPAITFVATASAPHVAGARIRFADVTSEDDLTLSLESVERLLTPATKAIMAVHYAGFPCAMEPLLALARKHDLLVIEDCAHALFTKHAGSSLGGQGIAGCFSFFSNKNATCGEGGAVLTNDDALAERVRLLRSHGMTSGTAERHSGRLFGYDVLEPGFNFRMDEIRAALMRVQLTRLEHYLTRRRELFLQYVDRLRDTPAQVPFATPAHLEALPDTAVHVMSVLLPEGVQRPAIAAAMRADGIQTSHHYPPIHRLSAFEGNDADAPISERIGPRQITLPLYPRMEEDDVQAVVDSLCRAVNTCGGA